MSSSDESSESRSDRESIQLHARVSGHGHATMAGRDIHLHYDSGSRATRRVESDGLVEECPYPGLTAFTAEQARWYFGREVVAARLASRLADRLHVGGPLVVIGPSGAGKSSLLRAGLLPAISQRAVLPVLGSKDWPQLVFTPTSHPMAAAARQLIGLLGTEPGGVGTAAGSVDRLIGALRTKLDAPDGAARVVVVVDQFEELFTLCADDRERHEFLDLMTRIAEVDLDGRSLGAVVYGLRVDAYAHCVNYPQLRAALQDGQVVVGPMSQEELRQAILFPARDVGLDVEPGLVELLLRDLGAADGDAGGYEAGRLPLLAHALRATWQQRHGHTLTVQGYRVAGGVSDAVATTAEQVFTSLDDADQSTARALFLRLVKIGDGTDNTRRAMVRDELLRDSADPDTVSAVLEALTRGRLLTQEKDTVEITHEALLQAWPRLRMWIDEDRAGNLTRQELEEAASGWDRDQRDHALLFRGSRLDTARAWAHCSGRARDLSPAAHAFLTASIQHDIRGRRRRRRVVIVLSVLALAATAAAGVAFQQRGAAQAARATIQAQRDAAVLRQVSSEATQLRGTDPILAAKLDLVVYRMRHMPDVYANAPDVYMGLVAGTRTSLATFGGQVVSVAFSPDGHTLAASSSSGRIQLWNVTDLAHPAVRGQLANTDAATAVAFSPDGHTLASGDTGTDTVQLWDVTNSAHPTPRGRLNGPIECHDGIGNNGDCSVYSLTFSHNGDILASGSIAGVQLWNVADLVHPVSLGQLDPGYATLVAISPDGRTLATDHQDFSGGYAATIQLWNMTDAARPANVGHFPAPGEPAAVAFSSDGRTLADTNQDNTIELWGVANPNHPARLGQLVDPTVNTISSLTFSYDGHILASTGAGTSPEIRLWNVADPSHPAALGQLTTESNAVGPVAFSPDGHTFASGDLSIVLWETDLDQAIRMICSRSGNLTRQQWQHYIPDIPYDPPCT
jgi:WD40 repeat protein